MKTVAIIGYVFAAAILVGGFIVSGDGQLPMHGFSAVIAGATLAMLFILPSTALLGIAGLTASQEAMKKAEQEAVGLACLDEEQSRRNYIAQMRRL